MRSGKFRFCGVCIFALVTNIAIVLACTFWGDVPFWIAASSVLAASAVVLFAKRIVFAKTNCFDGSMLDEAPFVTCVWKTKPIIRLEKVSLNVAEIFGINAADFIAKRKNIFDFIHAGDIGSFHKDFNDDTHDESMLNFRIVCDGNNIKHIRCYLSRAKSRDEIIAFLFDVTAMIERKRKFDEIDEIFHKFMANIPGPAWIRKENGEIIYANDFLCNSLGLNSKEIIGKNMLDFCEADFCERLFATDKLAFETGSAQLEENYLNKNNGELRNYTVWKFVIESAENSNCIGGIGIDVTEQKKLERTVIENESFLRIILDNVPVGISVRDRFGTLIFANSAWHKTWRKTEKELAQDFAQRAELNFDERDGYLGEYIDAVRQVYEEGGEITIPEIHLKVRKPGKPEWISQKFVALTDVTGKVDRVIVVTEDISERKRIEQTVFENERRLRAIIANTPNVAIEGFDIDGTVLYWNDAANRFFGITEVDAIGKTLDKLFFTPEQAELFKDVLREISITGKPYGPAEWDFKAPDGSVRTLISTTFELAISAHRREFICMDVDITELKKAFALIENSDKKFRSLLKNSNDVLLVMAGCGEILFVSESVEKVMGYKVEQLLGINAFTLIYEEDLPIARDALERLMTKPTDFVESVTIRYKKADGNFVYIEYSAVNHINDNAIGGIVINARDISERIRQAELRAALEQQLLHAQKMDALGQLVGGIAHDFNNLLQGIIGFTELASSSLPNDSSERYELSQALAAAYTATELISRLMSFARKTKMVFMPLDMNNAVSELHAMLAGIIGKQASLEIDLDETTALIVNADKNQIEQALINLCLNARDASPTDGKIILCTRKTIIDDKLAARHYVEMGKVFARIDVIDRGVGIPKENIGRLFEPFFTTKQLGKGTGLGLSIVYGIVSGHAGFIEVESEVGSGTMISIFLPIFEPTPLC